MTPDTWANQVGQDKGLPFGARLYARGMANHVESGGRLLSWRQEDAARAMLVSERTIQRWNGMLRRRQWLVLAAPSVNHSVATYWMASR